MPLEDVGPNIARTTVRTGAAGGGALVKSAFNKGWGSLLAGLFLTMYEQFSHYLREKELTRQYLPEIAAILGKPHNAVEISDMEKVAEQNPVLMEALQRSRTRRNVAAVVDVACTFLASAAVFYLSFPVSAIVGIVAFMASEQILGSMAKKMFRLEEPSVNDQITHLEKLQADRITITPQQVEAVLAGVNGSRPVSPQATEILTEKLNQGLVRARELAFPEGSGVPELESRRLSVLEKTNAALTQKLGEAQQTLASTQQKIDELTKPTREKAGEIVHTVQDKALQLKNNAGETFSHLRDRIKFDPKQIIEERQGKAITPEAILQNRNQGGQLVHN